jgi:hypothetical protein
VKISSVPAFIVSIAALVCPALAMADALFFEKVAVKTGSENTCLRFARDVARNEGFQNVHSSGAEVAGVKDGVYVAITCVSRGQQPAIAIIMGVAPAFDTAKRIGHSVAGRVQGIICFDTPC